MPRRRQHVVTGFVAGAAVGGVVALTLPPEHRSIEILFAGIGGAIGGAAPDILEPATSPNHRDVCHSLVGGGAFTVASISHFRARCRTNATVCDARAIAAPIGSDERSNEEWKALGWRVLSALFLGFAAGYASHLLLDGSTTDGLPLLTRGF
jgi:membrane-bound metal-dependent hydrolase YbcI (DUF457 family)